MTVATPAPCKVRRLGLLEYADALAMQDGMVRLRREGKIPDTLLLVEHPHVVTMGSAATGEHVLVDEAEQQRLGLSVVPTNRGGDVTYHGPGQIVGYPILQLEQDRRDAHRYLRDLEQVLIATLEDFGIQAARSSDYTGVWVGDAKIAAIGVRLTRWVTSHGFALNVQPDLSYFETIVPCGIQDRGVTSMQRLAGTNFVVEEVEDRLVDHFCRIFQREVVT